MEQFLKNHKLQNFAQYETENLSNPMPIKEI